eukprot:1151913-Pelagomonas_calceolata.AAC.6
MEWHEVSHGEKDIEQLRTCFGLRASMFEHTVKSKLDRLKRNSTADDNSFSTTQLRWTTFSCIQHDCFHL